MKKSRIKSLCAAILAMTLGFSVLTGCGGGASSSSNSANTVTYNLNADPKTLDPALNQSKDGSIVISNLFVGLCKLDEKGKAVPGVAESWDISEDGITYTFHLKDTKWSNGEPVTAGDFEYAWKRVMNPNTAAEYAYQMDYIKGADAFNNGKGTEDQVGVKALDDKTLEVTLEAPCSYFLELMAYTCYYPVNKTASEANENWATKAETYISNGPFKMTDYRIKDQIVLEKNENYFDVQNVKIDKLVMKLVLESTSAWASYQSGEFDMVDLVPPSEIQGALANGTATSYKTLSNYFYVVNLDEAKASAISPEAAKALGDVRVRKALTLALDRPSIVDNVTRSGDTPAHSFVPTGMLSEDGKDFAEKEYFKPEGDVEAAKALLAEAGYPDGEGFPTIILSYNPEEPNTDVAQAVQDMWKKNLGINIELQSQEWKVFQTTRTSGNYELARHGWSGDYTDPMTFLDMWESTSGLNVAGYNNPEYDKLIQAAKLEQDSAKRLELLHSAEDMLMEDIPAIPVYYKVEVKGVKDYLKGVTVSPIGNVYFENAYIEGK